MSSSPPDVAHAVLDEYGAQTRAALAPYLLAREPLRHLYAPVADYPQRGGRMLRPSVCIATACALGADSASACRTAAAIELLHNAFLVHDDVEDESLTRRGRPTLNAAHGVAIAVNVGDALASSALRALIDDRWRLGPRLTLQLVEEAEQVVRETIEGQAIELGWRRDNVTHLTDADYLEMVFKKTCWYSTIFPMRAGALIATRGELAAHRFVRFGFFLGAAFQAQDDLLNLVGDETCYGKELTGDLWEGKLTLMLGHTLRVASAADRERLRGFLAKSRSARTTADVDWVRERLDAYGAIEYARLVAHALAGAAQHEFEQEFADVPESPDRRFLEALPQWVLARR